MAMNPRLLRPLASGFSPLTLEGLEAWWDFADSSTVTLDSGRVAAVADKSGRGRAAANEASGSTQPDYVTKAQNGRNVARFAAASTQRLTVASSTATFRFLHDGTASYIAAVVSFGNTANPDAAFGLLGNNAFASANVGVALSYDDRAVFARTDAVVMFVNRAVSGQFAAATVDNDIPTYTTLTQYQDFFVPQSAGVFEFGIDADNLTPSHRLFASKNGTQIAGNNWTGAPSESNATYDLQLGTTGNNVSPMTGDICEVIICSQQPAASQRASLRRYLAQKWGVVLA